MSIASVPLPVVRRTRVASSVRPGNRVPSRFTRKAANLSLRAATAADADAIHALIVEHLAEGHLLPREGGEIAVHAHRFVVVEAGKGPRGRRVVACGELAPLSRTVAEVRSLVVSRGARSAGLGHRIVTDLLQRASLAGYETVCVFTHAPSFFVRMGFSIVPHTWIPEKIAANCAGCPQFRQCGQYALVAAPRAARWRRHVA
jgi:amino-acid N-acetyltransferase